MSSQGPKVNRATIASPPFATGPTGGSPSLSSAYPFTQASIRDGSDWIAYKKQLLVANEIQSRINQNQWAQFGNDYRTQWKLGKYKGNAECTACDGGAFGGTGPY